MEVEPRQGDTSYGARGAGGQEEQRQNRGRAESKPRREVESRQERTMQRQTKVTHNVLCEFKAYFKKYPSELNAGVVRDVVESLAERLEADIIE